LDAASNVIRAEQRFTSGNIIGGFSLLQPIGQDIGIDPEMALQILAGRGGRLR
jgi:hypothetical protein